MRAFLAVFCTLIATAAWADEPIGRKPGQWEVTITFFERAVRTGHICLDAATDRALFRSDWIWGEHECSRDETRSEGGVVTLDRACLTNTGKIRRNVTLRISGGDDFYQYEVANIDPPLYGRSELTVRLSGRWLGACSAGQQPGELELDGKTIDLKPKAPVLAPNNPAGTPT